MYSPYTFTFFIQFTAISDSKFSYILSLYYISSNNLLTNTDLWAEAANEEVIKKEIKKRETASGYRIFSDSSYTKDDELKEYDYNDISKLEILVPINIRKEGTIVIYSYVVYYINLN